MNMNVAIQAGGASRRMGRDKAFVPFRGEPLIQRVCRRLEGLGPGLFFTGGQGEVLDFLGYPCFPDLVPDRGALGGIVTALHHAQAPLVAVVACDMPFASPELLRFAAERLGEADVAIFRNGEGLEPLHAVYRRDPCLVAARKALDGGLWRVDSWFPAVRVRVLMPEEYAFLDPEGRTFINVNTPEDLGRAERLEALD